MATRADRLQPVLNMAAKAEDTAAEVFNKARAQHAQEDQKLSDLNSYCTDYQQNLAQTGVRQSVAEVVRARGFLQQLLQAREQQTHVVMQFGKLAETKKQAWHKAHLKHRALKDLLARLRADEQRALTRTEEKMLDEWVTASFARKSAENLRH